MGSQEGGAGLVGLDLETQVGHRFPTTLETSATDVDRPGSALPHFGTHILP